MLQIYEELLQSFAQSLFGFPCSLTLILSFLFSPSSDTKMRKVEKRPADAKETHQSDEI